MGKLCSFLFTLLHSCSWPTDGLEGGSVHSQGGTLVSRSGGNRDDFTNNCVYLTYPRATWRADTEGLALFCFWMLSPTETLSQLLLPGSQYSPVCLNLIFCRWWWPTVHLPNTVFEECQELLWLWWVLSKAKQGQSLCVSPSSSPWIG